MAVPSCSSTSSDLSRSAIFRGSLVRLDSSARPLPCAYPFRIAETLPDEVLAKMFAPPKPTDVDTLSDPADLEGYDAFLFGVPTRYGNFPAQWRTFWDKTGKQWSQGDFWGKYAGLFVSSGTQGGGQESTAIAAMSTLAHHGFIYVPLGYKHTFRTYRIRLAVTGHMN